MLTNHADYFMPAARFDIPDAVYQTLIHDIESGKTTASKFTTSGEINPSRDPLYNFYYKLGCKDGFFTLYNLPDSTKSKIEQIYEPFLDFVGKAYRIKLKSMQGMRWLVPHSDKWDTYKFYTSQETSKNVDILKHSVYGDACSIHVGLKTNHEITTWYKTHDPYEHTSWQRIWLQKAAKLKVENQRAYLFNNTALHGVTGFRRDLSRWVLTITWEDMDYADLVRRYKDFING